MQHLWSWEVQTDAQKFSNRISRNSTNYPTLSVSGSSINIPKVLNSGLWKFKQLPTFFNLGKFKQLPNTCGLEKFKQMPNGFRTGSLEIQTTIPLFQFREVQSISQSFSTRVFGSSNNCPTVSVGVLGSSNNWLMVLGNGLAKFNQLLKVFSLVSRNKKNSPTTWICVMGSSNNCPTIVFFGSSNNRSTVSVLRLDNFKQLPNGFGFGSLEVLTTAQHLWSRDASISQRYSTQVFRSSNNCLMVLDYVFGISNNWSTNSVMSPTKFNQILNLFSLQSREIKRTAQRL